MRKTTKSMGTQKEEEGGFSWMHLVEPNNPQEVTILNKNNNAHVRCFRIP